MKSQNKSFIDKELGYELANISTELGVSINTLIEEIIKDFIKKYKNNEKEISVSKEPIKIIMKQKYYHRPKESRKIIQLGDSTSLLITLPLDWIRANNINKGDEVEVHAYDHILIVVPKK